MCQDIELVIAGLETLLFDEGRDVRGHLVEGRGVGRWRLSYITVLRHIDHAAETLVEMASIGLPSGLYYVQAGDDEQGWEQVVHPETAICGTGKVDGGREREFDDHDTATKTLFTELSLFCRLLGFLLGSRVPLVVVDTADPLQVAVTVEAVVDPARGLHPKIVAVK